MGDEKILSVYPNLLRQALDHLAALDRLYLELQLVSGYSPEQLLFFRARIHIATACLQ